MGAGPPGAVPPSGVGARWVARAASAGSDMPWTNSIESALPIQLPVSSTHVARNLATGLVASASSAVDAAGCRSPDAGFTPGCSLSAERSETLRAIPRGALDAAGCRFHGTGAIVAEAMGAEAELLADELSATRKQLNQLAQRLRARAESAVAQLVESGATPR